MFHVTDEVIDLDATAINAEVEILDNIMGSGKTTKILEWIDSKYATEKFIYVSPLISEVGENGRIHRDLKWAKFHSPSLENSKSKSDDLLLMLEQGLNICCTHSLYLIMDDRHLQEIKKHQYILIVDEELGVISNYDRYSESDLDSLMTLGCIERQEKDGMTAEAMKSLKGLQSVLDGYYRCSASRSDQKLPICERPCIQCIICCHDKSLNNS